MISVLGGSHFWNLKPAGKGSINVGNKYPWSVLNQAKETHKEPEKRWTGRIRAGEKKNPHWVTNTGSSRQGGQKEPNPNWVTKKGSSRGGFKKQNPKQEKGAEKGSHNGQRAGRENISSLSFNFFPYISNGNNNSNNSTTKFNSIFELPSYIIMQLDFFSNFVTNSQNWRSSHKKILAKPGLPIDPV
jgi:hypothetical protein